MSEWTRERVKDWFLGGRALYDKELCKDCQGFGVKGYPTTAGWRGGVGGMIGRAMVCDKCWGSGSSDSPWPSHRAYYSMKQKINRLEKQIEETPKVERRSKNVQDSEGNWIDEQTN